MLKKIKCVKNLEEGEAYNFMKKYKIEFQARIHNMNDFSITEASKAFKNIKYEFYKESEDDKDFRNILINLNNKYDVNKIEDFGKNYGIEVNFILSILVKSDDIMIYLPEDIVEMIRASTNKIILNFTYYELSEET